MDCRLPASSVHGIFQARILKWFAVSYSREIKCTINSRRYSVAQPCPYSATPWTTACQGSQFFTIPWSLLKLMSESVILSHLLSPPSPPALSLSQHQDIFRWVGSSHDAAKLLELLTWLKSSRNHPPPRRVENCLPQNRSLPPKRLGTANLENLALF